MVDSPKKQVRIPQPILQAAQERCAQTGQTLSQFILAAMCAELAAGDEEKLRSLRAEIRSEGRPRKDD